MADVFVTASKSETQGLTVLEALASSTPVVCANDPSYIDAILPGSFKDKYIEKEMIGKSK